MRKYLVDKEFLEQLDKEQHREVYAKIIALNLQEDPIEEITGKVTGGSLNVDGSSAIRRSCSLSMVAHDVDISDYIWGLNTKFKLEIGLKNNLNYIMGTNYPDILWFPQGTFAITSFSSSQSAAAWNISLQGQDKMCFLNGTLGGTIHSLSANFGELETYEEDDNGEIHMKLDDIPLRDIITDLVHHYGKEPFHNIVINDLDDYGLEMMEYRGNSSALYLAVNLDSDEVEQSYINGDQPVRLLKKNGSGQWVKDKDITLATIPYYNPRATLDMGLADDLLQVSYVRFIDAAGVPDSEATTAIYSVIKVENGQTCGYRLCDLVYAGELVANVGESVTSVLDKITQMLGQFEYFYDLDGRFIFQKKPSTIYTSWNNIKETDADEKYAENIATATPYEYIFRGGELIQSFNNAPNLSNIKNDFSIWGTRTGVSGNDVPIHLRYAIDKKPEFYKAIDGTIYVTTQELYDKYYEDGLTKVVQNYYNKLKNFTLENPANNVLPGLDAPEQRLDGSWTPGWWDIEDWAKYYSIISGKMNDDGSISSENLPNKSMKWYAKRDHEGCVSIKTLPGYHNSTSQEDVWLIIVNPKTGSINTQHGSGVYGERTRVCTLYATDWITGKASKVLGADGKEIKETFYYPYAGCTDSHTYLSFLKNDVETRGNKVYFYNPQFALDNFDHIQNEGVQQAIEKYKQSYKIALVDWRELIYRMALDYYKYHKYTSVSKEIAARAVKVSFSDYEPYRPNVYYTKNSNGELILSTANTPSNTVQYYKVINGDNFVSTVRLNNIDYYPTGYTGYEHYYQDMQAFWTQIYNTDPKHDFINLEAEDGQGLETMVRHQGAYNINNKTFEAKTVDGQAYVRRAINLSGDTRAEILHQAKMLIDLEKADDKAYLKAKEEDLKENGKYGTALSTRDLADEIKKLQGELEISLAFYEDHVNQVVATKKKEVNKTSQIWVNRYFKRYDPVKDKDLDKTLLYHIETENGTTYLNNWFDGIKWTDLVDTYCWKSNAPNEHYIGLCYEDVSGKIKYNIPEKVPKLDSEGKHKVDALGNLIYETKAVPHYFTLISEDLVFKKNTEYAQGSQGITWNETINKSRDSLTELALPAFVQKKNLWVRYWDSKEKKVVMKPILEECTLPANKTFYYRETDGTKYLPLKDLLKGYLATGEEVRDNLDEFERLYYTRSATGSGDNKKTLNKVYQLKSYIPSKVYDRLGNQVTLQQKKTKVVNGKKEYVKDANGNYEYETVPQMSKLRNYFFTEEYDYYLGHEEAGKRYWYKNVAYQPETLNFWFDFLDIQGDINKFAVYAIGDRSKAVNDSNVKAIYFREVPNVVWLDETVTDEERSQYISAMPGYTYCNMSAALEDLLTVSSQGRDAKSTLDSFLSTHTHGAENITISCIPIYHLQPNTKIYVEDKENKIEGEYVLQRMTIPLTYNGMMSLSGYKYVQNLY